MTGAENNQKENEPGKTEAPAVWTNSLNAGSVGRVDWSPLSVLTGIRPQVSKYGLPRYSPSEWKKAYQSILGIIPSAHALSQEINTVLSELASACDKHQGENTLRLRQRAIDIFVQSATLYMYFQELKNEVKHLAQCKLRIRKALEYVGVVEGINDECREIRKKRLTEDLVRDEVEEELFQEKGLCQEIRQLYTVTLNEYEQQYKTVKQCIQELEAVWSDEKETLEYEATCIGLTSASNQVAFHHGNARMDENMSSLETWAKFINQNFINIRETIESSKLFRQKVHSPILSDSARDLKLQDEKVMKAFLKRIAEVGSAAKMLECELNKVLTEIAHAESFYPILNKAGRQVDFNLKVAQTRLDIRSHRPGAEKTRDPPHMGLLREVKVINDRVSGIQVQLSKTDKLLKELYATRKSLERQIHVKRHSLSLDQDRCLSFRSKFPNTAYLLGY